MGAANTGGTGDTKSVTKKKSEEDTEVSAYEKELAKQEEEKKAEANVEMGLGTPSTDIIDGTLSDPREKDDTAAIQAIKDSKKTTTTNIGNGGNDGGNNNTPPPLYLKILLVVKLYKLQHLQKLSYHKVLQQMQKNMI